MTSRLRVRPIDIMVVLAIVGYAGYKSVTRPSDSSVGPSDFARAVSLEPLNRTAVHADGRLRSFASHAKTYMGYVSGSRTFQGQSYGFTYLDLMLRPEAYGDVDLIYIKNKNVRAELIGALKGDPEVDSARAYRIQHTGLISRTLLGRPPVIELLQRLGQDLIRTSKAVDAIQSGVTVSDPRFLLDHLRIIPPPSGNVDQLWLSPNALSASGAPLDDVHAGMGIATAIPGLDQALQKKLADTWSLMQSAWRDEDAPAVNEQLGQLASLLPTIAPNLYPSTGRLEMESWYFHTKSMTWVWLLYLACVIPLLMTVIYRWDGARIAGISLFVVAFGFHTASLIIRWYISGRWPNANMFEALTTSAWFGGVLALVLEFVVRRTPFRNIFALGSAVMSMAALMAAYYLPAQLDSAISNKMAALNDVWLYIHTNVIIWSYAIIGIACIPALLQLRRRWCNLWDEGAVGKVRLLILPIALGVLNYTVYLLLMHILNDPARELSRNALIGVTGTFWGSLMIVLLEGMHARARRKAGVTVERSASGGAAVLIMGGSSESSFLTPERTTAGQVFDGATMVLVELSFIMLWTGLVMGAIWADHSWGRPWGWDPKEVFALNTFLIFLILIHVRMKVKDKAFWTAIIAIIGFEVMMFNWIVVNFIITGLHSYA